MERLTNKREADAQRKDYENRIKNGYPRNFFASLHTKIQRCHQNSSKRLPSLQCG